MTDIREELVTAALARSLTLINYRVHNDMHKQYEFIRQTILADNSLTKDEKIEAIKSLTKNYDRDKILKNSGTRRICENCKQECLATLYCEFCVRNHLKSNFLNWTTKNDVLDDLIQKCQTETLWPNHIIEWIPYNKLKNIKFLTKGGFSDIYKAIWIDGKYEEWDINKRQLIRCGEQNVILKSLKNVESANRSWFDEAKSHLTISNKRTSIVQCYGLTQNISNGDYMLVMDIMDMNLREYLQRYHNQLTWKERINITFEIIRAFYFIHIKENTIHKDLHSGNILYSQLNSGWFISDLGFCGPANKLSKSIYGILPYIAPEVINRKQYTFKSDIYSIAMLMWEISSGQPPFMNYKYDDSNLAIDVINGMRPKIVLGTPIEYKNLMEKCWDADPSKRPDIYILWNKIQRMNLYYQSMTHESSQSEIYSNFELDKANSSINSRLFTSKIHQFENLSEPRNATEDELQAFYDSKFYDFNIPNNIDDFDKSNSQNNASELNSIIKDNSKELSKTFENLQIKDDSTIDYEKESIQQTTNNHEKESIKQTTNNHVKESIKQTKGSNMANEKDETYGNQNHSEEQKE
ncbi:kinase-like domain-containing protein [Rhizophagus clarus]|uniref:Kinase-like domain-containing protein n=1 Tax=Rhizophagus clarus TaxID=94130 RepID=A0A8H3QKP6_9GLOM|nr:kinase-like domain-containing protein [Rhizophagus clarus]